MCISEVFESISLKNYFKSDHSLNLAHWWIQAHLSRTTKKMEAKSTWEQMSIVMETEIMSDGPAALPDEETKSSQC